MSSPGAPLIRPVTRGMQRMLLAASILVFIAGVQTFVLTEQTHRYFAWTIRAPVTAAFLGAGYWAAGILEALAARERVWANARGSVPAIWIFTTLTAIATIIHLDLFRSDSFWAWAWFFVYFGVPVILGVVWVQQLRARGEDPPRVDSLPLWLRAIVGTQAAVMAALGIALFLTPLRVDQLWLLPLTELTARATGAWLIGWATVGIAMLWENDWRRVRNLVVSYLAWGLLVLAALARYTGALDWDAPRTWVGIVGLASVIITGAVGTRAAWIDTSRRSEPASPAPSTPQP